MNARADITIIELWPIEFTCQRCGMRHFDKLGWRYYEDFIIGEPAWWQTDPGGVSVCKCCYLELMASEAVA